MMDKQVKKPHKLLTGYLYFIVFLLIAISVLNVALAQPVAMATAEPAVMQSTTVAGYQHPQQVANLASQLVKSGRSASATDAAEARVGKSANATAPASYTTYDALDYLFDIYHADSKLIADFDYDGYFHKFSVTFDADVQADYARVYAELYISRDGGPWQHYFTTDEFNIYGDSQQDSYEVVTTLADGYPSDEYDIMIDLYQVGYDYPVASYDSGDTNALYALPLEDAERDRPDDGDYYEEHESHGGSMTFGLSAGLALLLCYRKRLLC